MSTKKMETDPRQQIQSPEIGANTKSTSSILPNLPVDVKAIIELQDERHIPTADIVEVVAAIYPNGRETGVQKTDAEYAADIARWLADVPGCISVVIDPSAASFIALLRRSERRYNAVPADNDVIDGIRETATALHLGRIKISPRLEHWKKEAAGYIWDTKSAQDRPVKENDHLMDATRYFVRTVLFHGRTARTRSDLN